ncbi:MAG: phosphoribosylglycinamide synthetase C domain-containing protein, partial [Clostridia bacterium]|nr:phosphoribosylglycinamide synthetase C domain-containing protein [Clostridia bacterium]
VFIAGAKLEDGKLLTNGGRVLVATRTAPTLEEAIDKAYAAIKTIHFDNAYYRTDIGQRALKAGK